MIQVWPEELPARALVDGYREALEDGRLRTPMEAGPPKMRRRFSAAPRPVEATFAVTADQKARLERFYREEVGGGTLPFLVPDQTRDGRAFLAEDSVVIMDDSDQPVLIEAWLLVVFGENPPAFAPRQRALGFTASVSFSVLPL